jgi:hypothetical protein
MRLIDWLWDLVFGAESGTSSSPEGEDFDIDSFPRPSYP